jgi:hypothetical protein
MRKITSVNMPWLATLAIVAVTTVVVASWNKIQRFSLALPSSAAVAPAHSDERCDVLVVGGTPSGIAAALAAARRGAKVVLVEERERLGGDIYYAMMNMFDVPMKPGRASPVVHGIFGEFFEQLGISFNIDRAERLFEQTVAAEPNIHLYKRTRVSRVFVDEQRIVAVALQPATTPGSGTTAGDTVKVDLAALDSQDSKMSGEKIVSMGVVIDATNDADLAVRAGVGSTLGREGIKHDKLMQSAGLLFSVSHVNWRAVDRYVWSTRPAVVSEHQAKQQSIDIDVLDKTTDKTRAHTLQPASSQAKAHPAKLAARGNMPAMSGPLKFAPPLTSSLAPAMPPKAGPRQDGGKRQVLIRLGGGLGNYAWERGDIVKGYTPHGPDILMLSINFGRQTDNNTVVLNTVNILGVDGTKPASRERAIQEASAEIPSIVSYLRQHMPGFEKAQLKRIAPELYIRETRHINGLYTLTATDVIQQRRFPDRIGMVSYPLDLHPYTRHDVNPYGPRRYYYTLPLRCLVPKDIDNLFVASRSISATYDAAGSARVVPITMAGGEASGTAAWLCTKDGISVHALMQDPKRIGEVQDALRDWGVDIGDNCPPKS